MLRLCDSRGWDCVAAYEPLRTEPGSVELLIALADRGIRVLVPVTLEDRDLDWRRWSPSPTSAPAPRLGLTAIADAELLLVPALAVAPDGTRLGRGGGSYDRALARRSPDSLAAAVVFADEIRPELPHDAWDLPVDACVTPDGWRSVGGNTRLGLRS